MNLRSWGVDLVEESIFIALGIPSRPRVMDQPSISTAYYFVPAAKSGMITEMPAYETLVDDADVIWSKPLVRIGDTIVGPDDGRPTWVLDLLVQKPSAKEALDYVWKLEEESSFRVVCT